MKIANLAVAALSSLLLTIGGVDGSRGSTAINVEDPYLFLGHLSLRASEGGTDAPTSAPTPAPTTVDSSIVCPTDSYNRTTVHRSGDCTKAGICFNGDLQAHTIVECDVAGAIYDVNCVDPDTTGFHGCCTNNTAVTCPTPSPTSSPSATPSKTPTKAPTSSPTMSPTAAPTKSPTKSPTKAPTNAEQAGYEASMTTADDAWVWTRDYSTCNRRRLEEDSAKTSTNKKGVRGASRRRAQKGDDIQGDGDFDSNEIKTSFRDDEEGVGDDVDGDKNDPFDYVPPGYDDIEYDAITDKSNELKTSEREYDDEDDEVDGDKKDDKNKNKNNGKTCVPAVLPVARQSAAMTTAQICPSSASPFGGPVTVAKVNGRTVPESSGICASHINPNIIWAHNDYSNHHSLFAVSTTDGSVRRFPIKNGKNFDYEDIACGRGPIPGRGYVYVGDIGDNYARRKANWNPMTIYRVQEPNLKTLKETSLTKWDKLELRFTDGPHNCEAMMIDPVSLRIFILTKSSGTIWVTPQKWGAGSTSMTLQKVGRIKKMTDSITGMDISPDGKELVVKFYDSIHYFCMGTRQYSNPDNAWRDVVNVLQNNNGISVPYKEEPQGEAVCFGQNFGAGLYTLSEARGSAEFPLIHHARL